MRFPSLHTIALDRSLRGALAIVLAMLVAGALAPGAVQAQEAATPLAEGQSRSDSLATGDPHTYTVDLEADQFVYGEANQQTVDVVVTVYGPDGNTLDAFDNPARGAEPFQFSTDAAGPHRIEVTPFEQEQGRYTVALKRVESVATAPEKRVDQLMAAYEGEDTPGGVVGVVQGGEVTFSEGYGMADLAQEIPITQETRFNLGSASKQFLGFAFALLAERGKLSLDDSVGQYLPDWPAFDQTVTLRHLLTHTSGYREAYGTLALAGRIPGQDHLPRAEALEVVRRQPELEFPAGSKFQYNSTAYVILAEVLEQVTGTSAGKWVEENVFGPLGMENSAIESQVGEVIPEAADSYTNAEDGGGYTQASSNRAIFGAAEVYTTVDDLAKWFRNFHTADLGGPAVQKRMREPFVLTTGDTTDYALGLFVDEHRGLRRIWHTGAHAGYRAQLTYYPDLETGVVVMSNYSAFAGGIPGKVAEAFLGKHMTEESGVAGEIAGGTTFDPEAFDALVGRYKLEGGGMILTFTREDDEFFVQATGQPKARITPTSDSTFAVQSVEARVTFHRGTDGKADSLTLHQNGERLAHRIEPWRPSAADRAAFAGRYFSEELQTFYTVAEKDTGLVVQHRWLGDIPLTPTEEDTFSGEYPIGELVFTRDEAGHVTSLSVSALRTRGVRFEKRE